MSWDEEEYKTRKKVGLSPNMLRVISLIDRDPQLAAEICKVGAKALTQYKLTASEIQHVFRVLGC